MTFSLVVDPWAPAQPGPSVGQFDPEIIRTILADREFHGGSRRIRVFLGQYLARFYHGGRGFGSVGHNTPLVAST